MDAELDDKRFQPVKVINAKLILLIQNRTACVLASLSKQASNRKGKLEPK